MVVKFFSFALVGVPATVAHYLVLYILVEFLAIDPVTASGCGSILGLIVSYALNFKWTFNSNQSHLLAFPKFACISLMGMSFNLVLMAWLTETLHYFVAQVLTTLTVFIWNFTANFFWTFKMDRAADSTFTRMESLCKKPGAAMAALSSIILIRLITLGLYPLYDPSESRYAEMARKMLETHNWTTPMIDYGVPFWGKPPLTIWLSAVSLNLAGVNDFAARLPSFLLGAGIVGIVFQLVKRQSGYDKAVSSVLILFSCLLFFVMSGTVAMDQCMSFGITLALTCFWLALKQDKPLCGYGFFLGLSIGLMAKGPITLVLCGVCIGLWTLLTGRWLDIWKRIPWISGTLLMLCVSAPWYLLAEQATPGFLEYFFVGEHWKRFTESGWKGDLYGVGRAQERGMIWVYWLAGGFPWTLILLSKLGTSLWRQQAAAQFRSVDDWRLYCLLWMLSPLLFFTFSANIIWTYVLPGLPGLALLLADWLPKPQKYRSALTLTVPVLFLGAVIVYQLPSSDFFKSQKRLVEAYQQLATADERLFYINEKNYSVQFYLQGKAEPIGSVETLEKDVPLDGHHFILLRKHSAAALSQAVKAQLEPIKTYGEFVLFHATGK